MGANIRMDTPAGGVVIEGIDASVFIALRDEGHRIGSKLAVFVSEDCMSFNERTALLAVLHPIVNRIVEIGVCSEPNCEACEQSMRVAKEIQAICIREESANNIPAKMN